MDIDSISQQKTCTKCGAEKPHAYFPKDKTRQDGRFPWCRSCKSDAAKSLHRKNPEQARLRAARRREQKPEAMKDWRAANQDRIRAYNVDWYWSRRDEERERETRWRRDNPHYCAEYYARNRERIRAYSRRLRSVPKARLDNAISRAIHHALRGEKRGRTWESLVGYSIDDLMRHLEQSFLPGMTWENYGKGGWHVDHRIPKSAFNYERAEHIDFKRAWALDNLQPMWEPDNLAKGARLDRPFQPSLAI